MVSPSSRARGDTRPGWCALGALALCFAAACSAGGARVRVVSTPGASGASTDAPAGAGLVAEHASESAAPVVPSANEAPDAWIATKLGWKPFALVGLSGHEQLGRSYRFSASVVVASATIEAEALLGTLATVGIRTPSGMSYFSGYISQVETRTGYERAPDATDPEPSGRALELVLVPWTELLSKRADCAIFVERDVPSVLRRFLDQRPFSAYRVALARRYPQVPFFVQYRETDANFVQRLVEHVGITTYFEHGPSGHTLVLTDRAAPSEAPQVIALDGASAPRVRRTLELHADRYVVRASTPGVSAAHVEGAAGQRSGLPAALEIYDFEASARDQDEATFYAGLRADEQRSKARRVEVYDVDRIVRAGALVQLTHGPRALRGSYRVLSADIQVTVSEGEVELDTSFEALPAEQPFRPERTTPWPIISGPQVALVVESDVRDPAQVKLRFAWTRGEPGTSDLWLPVARVSGAVPAPGSEVLVEFLEGEPSRPVVVAVLGVDRRP